MTGFFHREYEYEFIQVVACINIFLWTKMHSIVWICYILFICSSVDEHFGYFSFLIIMNNSAVIIHVKGFFLETSVFSFFGWIPRRGISKLDGNSVLILRNYQTALQSSSTILCAHQQCMRIPFSTSSPTLVIVCLFYCSHTSGCSLWFWFALPVVKT